MPPAVLLSSHQARSVPDLGELLASAGFAVRGHTIGVVRAVEFGDAVVAVIDVGNDPVAAATQTRRWRAELADNLLPILWVLPSADSALIVLGLDAGADAVLTLPLDPAVVVAQVRAAARSRAVAARVAARAAESRLLGEQLTRVRDQLDREHAVARGIHLAFLHRPLPELGAIRFHVCHRPRARTGGDFYAVHPLDPVRVAFLIGDVTGVGAATSLLGTLLASSVTSYDTRDPGRLLSDVNRQLLRLRLDDLPLIAMCAGIVNTSTGDIAIARAGLPAPVYVPTQGDILAWSVPGPFLGTAETTYPIHSTRLESGDKLLVSTDGLRAEGSPGPVADPKLVTVATEHRELVGQRFVDSVVARMSSEVLHEEDITLMSVEFRSREASK
jgi:phosphoserine phosphatase RsbU/P